jgi:hypothetical protein
VVLEEAPFVNALKVVVMLEVKNVLSVELEKIKNLDVVNFILILLVEIIMMMYDYVLQNRKKGLEKEDYVV